MRKNKFIWIYPFPYLLLVGLLLGGISGILMESIISLERASSVIGITNLFPIAVFYSLIFGVVGGIVGLFQTLLSVIRRRPPSVLATKSIFVPLLFCLLLFVLVGGYVNAEHLPAMFSTFSLVFDAGLFACCTLLWLVLFQVLRRKAAADATYFRWRSPLTVCLFSYAAVLIAFAVIPDGGESPPLESQGTPPEDINILLLLFDAMRPDHLGCYGYERATSPTMDRLASTGVRFTRAYANAPLTKESTASMITSLYPSTHNVRRLADGLPLSAPTLPEVLHAAGYRTAILSANPMISPLFGFDRGVDFFYSPEVPIAGETTLGHVVFRIGSTFPGMGWMSDLLMRFLKMLPSSRTGDVPFTDGSAEALNQVFLQWIDKKPGSNFFAYLHYMEPHAPYAPNAPFDSLFDPNGQRPRITDPPPYFSGFLPFVPAKRLEDDKHKQLVAQYDGCIAEGDAQLLRLLNGLRERNLLDKTLVIITADHGEEFYDHGGWGHGQSLFEELIGIPLVLSCPSRLKTPKEVDAAVTSLDLMPTLLGAAGVAQEGKGALQGRNLWPALVADHAPIAEPLIFTEVFHGSHFARSLTSDDKKIIFASYQGEERVMIFDLSKDPHERDDLADRMPELKETLTGRLEEIHERAVAEQKNTSAERIDSSTMERLRSLGYVQ